MYHKFLFSKLLDFYDFVSSPFIKKNENNTIMSILETSKSHIYSSIINTPSKSYLTYSLPNSPLLTPSLEINENYIELSGTLFKWTDYLKGYRKRWFVLSNGLLSYYRHV